MSEVHKAGDLPWEEEGATGTNKGIGQQQTLVADLDSVWLPHPKLLHVDNFSCVTIQPKRAVCTVCMLGSELSQCPDHIGSAVLGQSARNDL